MMRFRNTVLIVLSLLTIWATGCANIRKPFSYIRTPRPMTTRQVDVLKAQLGNVGVVGAGYTPHVILQIPAKGVQEGTQRGAQEGAEIPAQLTSEALSQCSDLATCLIIAGAGLVLVPVGASIGGNAGGAKADDAETVNAREAQVKQALLDLRMQEQMRDRISSRLADLKTFPIKPLQAAGPSTNGHRPDYRPMKSNGIDTVSEIAVQSLALTRRTHMNPDLAVNIAAQVRLISTSDNRELFARNYSCMSNEYKFKELAEHEARIFREEIDRCYENIAENAVNDLFVNDTIIKSSW